MAAEANFRKITDQSNLLAICMTAEKEQNTSKKTNYFLTNYTSAIGEDSYEEMREIAQKEPSALEEAISQMGQKHGKTLADEVGKSPETVLKRVDAKYATSLAYEFIGDESYKAVRNSLDKDEDARKEFSNLYESELWKALVSLANSETIKSAAKAYIERTTRREIQNNFYKIEDKKLIYDPDKTAKFLTREIEELKDEEKEKYFQQIGLSYYQTQIDNKKLETDKPVLRTKDSYLPKTETPQTSSTGANKKNEKTPRKNTRPNKTTKKEKKKH